jgi:putative addiction module component (TIGR02574 family)
MIRQAIDIESLSREEQLELLDRLWESLGRDPSFLPLSEDQVRDRDERLDDREREGPTGRSWEVAVDPIRNAKAR